MKIKTFVYIFLALLCGSLILGYMYFSKIISNVKHISDGDTFTIERDGIKVKIRLAEVDCPEKNQPYGIEARDFVEKFIEGKTITLTPIQTDRYGRTLAHVRANNDDIGEALIKNGYAWVYRQYSKNKKLIELEDKAKKEKVGLWKDPHPIAPWTWRKHHK